MLTTYSICLLMIVFSLPQLLCKVHSMSKLLVWPLCDCRDAFAMSMPLGIFLLLVYHLFFVYATNALYFYCGSTYVCKPKQAGSALLFQVLFHGYRLCFTPFPAVYFTGDDFTASHSDIIFRISYQIFQCNHFMRL